LLLSRKLQTLASGSLPAKVWYQLLAFRRSGHGPLGRRDQRKLTNGQVEPVCGRLSPQAKSRAISEGSKKFDCPLILLTASFCRLFHLSNAIWL